MTTLAGLLSPAARAAVSRTPGFFDGQWWRLISPILINPEGWYQIVFNAAALLVLGTVAERVYGRIRWTALYLTGALAGRSSATRRATTARDHPSPSRVCSAGSPPG
ncbi:rhomboid family intramembrane serine protease [Streptosporangium lutulentum]